MGLFDDEDDELDDLLESVKKYPSCVAELNEGNVQAIFNRCLAKKDTPKTTTGILFPITTGYKFGDDLGIGFDQDKIKLNKQNIEYIYGQLANVHTGKTPQDRLTVESFLKSYQGISWTENKGLLLQLLYLGSTTDTTLISLFNAKDNATTFVDTLKPTLSPKDPNFPAWWEEHKSEWEEPKKEN